MKPFAVFGIILSALYIFTAAYAERLPLNTFAGFSDGDRYVMDSIPKLSDPPCATLLQVRAARRVSIVCEEGGAFNTCMITRKYVPYMNKMETHKIRIRFEAAHERLV